MRLTGFALGLVSAVAFLGSTPAAAAVDWARTVVATPQGGFRMGNPRAKVKLIEYGSLACPHCRHFEETGYRPLVQEYVRTGRVSYEFRNLLLNTPDISASLLAHCAGPAKFFPMAEVIYATQPQWFGKLAAMSDAQKAEVEAMPIAQRIVRFGEVAGFPQVAARFGVTAARSRQCLSDPKGVQRLLDVTKGAGDAGINHTPTFLINGKVAEATTWEDLQPKLRAALGG